MTRLLAFILLMSTTVVANATTTNILPYQKPQGRIMMEIREDALRLMEHPPRNIKNETDLACMAVTIYHEARGESIEGQKAVASVIIQRALVPHRWGDTPCEVVQPVQFSYLTKNRNFKSIDMVNEYEAWQKAVRVALTMLVTGPDDRLLGADHYHTHDVFPSWRLKMDKIAEKGEHRFYVDPDSKPKDTNGHLLLAINAKGFDNRGGVYETGIGQVKNTRIAHVPYQATPAPRVQQRKVAEVYDWSGTGVPEKTQITQVANIVRTQQDFKPLPQNDEPQKIVAFGFNPVKGIETGRVKVAQNKPTQTMGLKPVNTQISGVKMGINPGN